MMDKSKKFISLFLVFSLIAISCTTITTQRQKRSEPSKERKHGAKLIITEHNGQQTEGELITVKPNSLLLLDRYGRDVSIEIEKIRTVRIVKKSKARLGSVIGGVIAIGVVALVAISANHRSEEGAVIGGIILAALLSVPASVVGGTIGAIVGMDKTIYFLGMTDSEIQEILDKLRKKARIRDYR